LGGLAIDQNALAVDAPSIARQRAIVANDTMAGNSDGELIRGARSCHGAE
jgi:hypothetical protein